MTAPEPTVTVKAPPGTRVQMPVIRALMRERGCLDCMPQDVTFTFDPAVHPDPDCPDGWTVVVFHAPSCPALALRLLREGEL